MIQEVTTTELLNMRNQAEQSVKNIGQISRDLSVERKTLYQVVNDYDKKRIELVKQRLVSQGMTWCTCCSEVIPEMDTVLLLEEGKNKISCGYENSCYEFCEFSILHRVCPECRQNAADRHGWQGDWDSMAKDQENFNAFSVEKREDGYYARKFGNWIKLDDETYRIKEPSRKLIEKLAEEWNFPPRIEVGQQKPEECLVVYERTATTKAN